MRFRISGHHRLALVELRGLNVDGSTVVAVNINHGTLAIHAIDESDFQMVKPHLVGVGVGVVSRGLEFDVRDARNRHANVVVHARIIPCPRSLCKGF